MYFWLCWKCLFLNIVCHLLHCVTPTGGPTDYYPVESRKYAFANQELSTHSLHSNFSGACLCTLRVKKPPTKAKVRQGDLLGSQIFIAGLNDTSVDGCTHCWCELFADERNPWLQPVNPQQRKSSLKSTPSNQWLSQHSLQYENFLDFPISLLVRMVHCAAQRVLWRR